MFLIHLFLYAGVYCCTQVGGQEVDLRRKNVLWWEQFSRAVYSNVRYSTSASVSSYQTRETVFHRDIQTSRRELKIRRAADYF